MAHEKDLKPRDPAKSVEYYRSLIALEQKSLESALGKNAPILFESISNRSLRIARATYSAGEPVGVCKQWLEKAGTYQTRYLTEGVKFKLGGIGDLGVYLERFSAASLTGQAKTVVDAFRLCTVEHYEPWEKGVLDQFCAVLTGGSYKPTKTESEALQKCNASFHTLPQVFDAVDRRDHDAFAQAMEDYLTKFWGPSAERGAKQDLKSRHPVYTGTWSFFSVALCNLIGFMPNLSKKAKKHVPVDLFLS